ncbi:MAG: hypothetical protein EXR57_05240 [Dehalococcoidia bacterium]|nr:hypothetical protein [Dehalococcoidia bacterium]MSQ35202.1 hypothetical protein [Dehalococcoidia bacterium]
MARFINYNSFLLLLAAFAIALALLLPAKRWQTRALVVASCVALVLGGYVYLRPGESTVSSTTEVDDLIAQSQAGGKPVFIEFFSNT